MLTYLPKHTSVFSEIFTIVDNRIAGNWFVNYAIAGNPVINYVIADNPVAIGYVIVSNSFAIYARVLPKLATMEIFIQ
jgi:hypothetical protein